MIDPKKKIRLTITYPASTGRNFDEILRVIDSLQLTDHYSVATPVDWKDGQDCVIVPSLKDPEILQRIQKPTPMPDLPPEIQAADDLPEAPGPLQTPTPVATAPARKPT